jgi:hypothetical protein
MELSQFRQYTQAARDNAVAALVAFLKLRRNLWRDSVTAPQLKGKDHDTPADVEYDTLIAEAMLRNFIVVQISPRKYALAELSYIRKDNIVVPYTKTRDERYSWSQVLDAYTEVITKREGR